jgi:tRNA-specific adenosine deaminase 1
LTRFLLSQIQECLLLKEESIFERIENSSNSHYFKLKSSIEFAFYCSQAPCGDASMHELAARNHSNNSDSINNYSLDDHSWDCIPHPIQASSGRIRKKFKDDRLGRGRQDYSKLRIVRTKPGRGDAQSTESVSCNLSNMPLAFGIYSGCR